MVMTAVQRWKSMVEAEHAQSDRMQGSVPPADDHWRPYAQQFKADPGRTDDPLVNRLLEEVSAEHRVLDVGAGGGRLALPLALHCHDLTAVEPSSSMVAVLREQASEFGISNVTVVENRWEDAEVDPGDVVLCAHVLYVIRDIEHFVRKMDSHARGKVLIVLYQSPPQSQIYPLWEQVHGEKRLALPSLPQLLEVLSELGIDPQVEMLPPQPSRGFDNHEHALDQLTRRLYLAPGTPQLRVLEGLLPDLLVEQESSLVIRDAKPPEPGLVWWCPKPSRE